MRCPSGDIFKKANTANVAIIAKIEPMLHAARNVDHVAAFDGDAKYRSIVGMNVKDSFTGNRKTHFILVMNMFPIKFLEHRI